MKIYHVADIHLGRKRLEGRIPSEDFVRAFQFIAKEAVQDKADVFLITGDLFDRPQVEPAHLRQAKEVLLVLQQNNIPVIAVEGNHDKLFVHSDEQTWAQFLAEEDLLILLRPSFNANGAVLKAWDTNTRSGAWVDIGGVHFVGAGYLGAATPAKVRQIVARLETGPPNVLLLHAGPDYFVGEGGGFAKDDLRLLEEKVCYLALGHIHKPMIHGDWACNPGSPENCELREAASDRRKSGTMIPRGYAVVEIDPNHPAKPRTLEVRSNPRRPVYRIELDCTSFGNKTKKGAKALMDAAVKAIAQVTPTTDSVIDLCLTGRLNLNRIALDQSVAAAQIEDSASVLAVAMDTTRLNLGTGYTPGGSTDDSDIPRDELERRAIRSIVESEALWGLDHECDRFAGFFFDLKEAVRMGRAAEEITEQIAASPLVESIRSAKALPPLAQSVAAVPEPPTEGGL